MVAFFKASGQMSFNEYRSFWSAQGVSEYGAQLNLWRSRVYFIGATGGFSWPSSNMSLHQFYSTGPFPDTGGGGVGK